MAASDLGAVNPRLLSHPHPEPRPYHLVLRTWTYSWWRPLVGLIVAFAGMFIVLPLVALPVLIVGLLIDGGTTDLGNRAYDELTGANTGPVGLLYLNITLALLIVMVWFVVRVFHRMRLRWVSSVRPGLRWPFLFGCLGMAVVALIASMIVGAFLPGNIDGTTSTQQANAITATVIGLGLVMLLTTPLQAAGEEYLFRGYLVQAFGALFDSRYVVTVFSGLLFLIGPGGWSPEMWIGRVVVGLVFGWIISYADVKYAVILLSAFAFALAHGGQNFPLFFDRFSFGVIAAWLVIRTGGLEAGIAMHVLNNMLAFSLAILFGDVGSSLNVSDVSYWIIPSTVTQSVVYAALVVWLAKAMKVQSKSDPPMPQRAEDLDLQPA